MGLKRDNKKQVLPRMKENPYIFEKLPASRGPYCIDSYSSMSKFLGSNPRVSVLTIKFLKISLDFQGSTSAMGNCTKETYWET